MNRIDIHYPKLRLTFGEQIINKLYEYNIPVNHCLLCPSEASIHIKEQYTKSFEEFLISLGLEKSVNYVIFKLDE